jgi:hypothetical protein
MRRRSRRVHSGLAGATLRFCHSSTSDARYGRSDGEAQCTPHRGRDPKRRPRGRPGQCYCPALIWGSAGSDPNLPIVSTVTSFKASPEKDCFVVLAICWRFNRCDEITDAGRRARSPFRVQAAPAPVLRAIVPWAATAVPFAGDTTRSLRHRQNCEGASPEIRSPVGGSRHAFILAGCV